MFNKILFPLMAIFATNAMAMDFQDQARIVDVRPLYQNVQRPIQICDQYAPPPQQEQGPNMVGAVVGALAGGLLGNTVGKGNGNKIATGVGAATGAVIGSQYGNGSSPSGPNCRTDYENDQRVSGYQITLDYQGKTLQETLPENVQPPRVGDFMGVRVNVMPESGHFIQGGRNQGYNPGYRQDRRW